jgi:CubicO group peptidase (beta-lactamase class C family)
MKRIATALALLSSTALWGQARPAPAPAPRAQAAALLPQTQALFDAYVQSGKVPGIVGAFGAGPLPTVFVQSGRIAEGAAAPAAGPDSLWRVYSMTKPVTAMAAMILVEEGKLRLDQPIAELLPAFRTMRVQLNPESLESRPARTPITVRHLLTHTAGLGYNIITKGPLLKEYERLGIVPAALGPQLEPQLRATRPTSLAQFADRVATLPLIAEPGTKWSFSIGLDLMGRVIEVASGMPFDRFLQARIFTPLGMTSTYFTVPGAEAGRLATNYAWVGANRVPVDTGAASVFLQPPSFPYGGAGLVSSARDYDRFLHMLQNYGELDGVRVMKAETARLAMSDLLPAGVKFGGIAGGTGGTTADVPMGYGAGGSVYLADRPGGPGKGTYGWGGAAGTIAFVDAARQARGTIMVNYIPADRWPLRQDAVAALGRDTAALRARFGRQ